VVTKLEIIENALNWQKEGVNRWIQVAVEPEKFEVWAYDGILGCGDFVQDGRIIDLEAKSREEKQSQYEKLKAELEV
jgi:hypothetical protein